METTINVGCVANDKYAQHAGVMLCSLLENTKYRNKVKIFFVDSGLSQNNKNNLQFLVNSYGARVSFIKVNKKKFSNLKICGHLGLETYYRFSLFDDKNISRILYLDSDMVILDDISKLFSINFQEKIILAVKELAVSQDKIKSLNIPSNGSYFNAGLLLVDCEQWRKKEITKKLILFMQKNSKKIEWGDQDGLNAILFRSWKELNPTWNVINNAYFKYFFFSPAARYENFNRRKVGSIIHNARIIHYAGWGGEMKPWSPWLIHPRRSKYYFYLSKTPWSNFKISESIFVSIFKKAYMKVYIHLTALLYLLQPDKTDLYHSALQG